MSSLKSLFQKALHATGFYEEKSFTRVNGIDPYERLSDTQSLRTPAYSLYFLKINPDIDGVKAKLSLMVEARGLSIPRWTIGRAAMISDSYCYKTDLGQMPLSDARRVITKFNEGALLEDILPVEAFDYAIVHGLCDAEEKFGIRPRASQNLNAAATEIKSLGYK